jgi:hypothetical protein
MAQHFSNDSYEFVDGRLLRIDPLMIRENDLKELIKFLIDECNMSIQEVWKLLIRAGLILCLSQVEALESPPDSSPINEDEECPSPS